MTNEDQLKIEPDKHAEFLSYFTKDHQRLFGYIFSLLHNRADTEDVFQQTSLTLWRRFDEFDRDREFFPWGCGIAFNSVRNFLRVSGRSRLRFNDQLLQTIAEERIPAEPQLRNFADRLEWCIARLGDRDRELIRQAYSKDQTATDIAKSTGRALQTVYNRLNLIRRELGNCVQRQIASDS